MTPGLNHPQRGSALIISLLFLLVLTLIGLSSLGNSGMEARMAHNFQLNNTVFQTSESMIEHLIFRADRGSITDPNTDYVEAEDPINNALNGGELTTIAVPDDPPAAADTALIEVLEKNNESAKLDLTATAEVLYVGYREFCPGGGACNQYQITAVANLAATSAAATHIQSVSLPAPVLE